MEEKRNIRLRNYVKLMYKIILQQPFAMMSSEEYPGSPPPPPMGAPSGLFGLGRPQAHQLSPYLNVNPSYVQTPEFIVNQVRNHNII